MPRKKPKSTKPQRLAEPAAASPPTDLAAHYAALFKRVKSKLTLDVMMVAPKQAAEWLARNKGNRPLGGTTVDRYAAYMQLGEWVVNGEPVILDDEENLLDGQHRLEAVIRSGVSVPMLVVYGVPAEVFPTLNTGKTRCLADVLAIKGEANQRTLAGALRLVYFQERGQLASLRQGKSGVSNLTLAAELGAHPNLRHAVEFVSGRCQRGLHPPAVLSFLYYRMAALHPDEARGFFTRLLTQEGIPPGGVESKLNAWVHANPAVTRVTSGVLLYMAVWIKAWNLFVRGGPVPAHLVWRPENNESFPAIL